MDRVGTVRALSLCISIALCGCQGRTVETATDHDGGGAGASSGGSPAGATCPTTPKQLVDFNTLSNDLGGTGISATQLAADASSLYFVLGGALVRVPLQGGAFSTLAQFDRRITQLYDPVATSTAVVLHHVVNNGNDEAIVSVPKAGGPPKTLATTNGSLSVLTADDSAVYFIDRNGLQSLPLTGGSAKVLPVTLSAAALGLAVVGSNVIVTTGDPFGSDGAVYSVPIAGGTPTTLATQQPNASFPMACGADICWWTGAVNSPSFGPTGPGFIARASGGRVTTIPAPVAPWSLVFDGTDFFETVQCDACSGTLVRIPSSGGAQVTMATAGYAIVKGDCLYFSVVVGFDLPSSYDGGIPDSGVYAVSKSYADPMLQRDM